jgi:hypothetical protein
MDADEGRYAAAIALAPFLAEHYHATGRDLVDVAALDQMVMDLAAAYAQLPALAQQISEATARPGIPWPVAAHGRRLCWQANELLGETATAIRNRLGVLADRDRRYSRRQRRR